MLQSGNGPFRTDNTKYYRGGVAMDRVFVYLTKYYLVATGLLGEALSEPDAGTEPDTELPDTGPSVTSGTVQWSL